MNDLWLSDIIETDSFFSGTFNIIVAPCGCGKSHAAINVIAPMASSPSRVLYLIDTTAGCKRIGNEKSMILPHPFYGDDTANKRTLTETDKTKIVVATYARFGVWCSQYPNFSDHFELIICDEVHNLVQFATFSDESNYTAVARESICAAVVRGKTMFVGITATPDYLKKLRCPQYHVPLDTSELKHYTEKEIIHYASIKQLMRQLPTTQRGALYVPRVTQMKEYASIARECGHNPICLWSPSNEKHEMTPEQNKVRAHLLEFEEVPPQYDLLIINASCETAINIRSHMDYFIVHNSNPTHIIQARGRYRGNLETLYLLDKEKGTVYIPETYLNRPLFKEDKSSLNEDLYIKNGKGRFIPWSQLSQMITDSGYNFSEGRDGNRPYTIIRRL